MTKGPPHNILRKFFISFFFSLEIVMTDDAKGAINGVKVTDI